MPYYMLVSMVYKFWYSMEFTTIKTLTKVRIYLFINNLTDL